MGKPCSTWTCADLAQDVMALPDGASDTTPLTVSRETVRRHLHQLGYRIIRPVLTVRSPDPDDSTKAEQVAQYRRQAE